MARRQPIQSDEWPARSRLFAGLGSTVEFTNEPGKLYSPGMTVFAAQSVLIDPRYDPANGLNFNFSNNYQITVSPDPAPPPTPPI